LDIRARLASQKNAAGIKIDRQFFPCAAV
jgi:hypothetical protein